MWSDFLEASPTHCCLHNFSYSQATVSRQVDELYTLKYGIGSHPYSHGNLIGHLTLVSIFDLSKHDKDVAIKAMIDSSCS